MATLPSPATATAGNTATAASFNTLRDSAQFLLGSSMTGGGGRRAVAQMRQTVSQSPATGTFTSLTFTTEDVDYDAGHSTSSTTSRYTAVTAGWYQVSAGISWTANATGRRGGQYAVNGTAVNGSAVFIPATASSSCSVPLRTMLVFLNVTDYVEVQGYQDSGGGLATAVSSEQQSTFTVQWVSN